MLAGAGEAGAKSAAVRQSAPFYPSRRIRPMKLARLRRRKNRLRSNFRSRGKL